MVNPQFHISTTKCIICGTRHKKNIWIKHHFILQKDFPRSKNQFKGTAGYCCNKKFKKLQKRQKEEQVHYGSRSYYSIFN